MPTIAGQFSSAQISDFVWPDHHDVGDMPPAIQAFGETMDVSRLKGEIGYALSKDRIAQGDDSHVTKVGFGDSVQGKEMAPDTASYHIQKKRQEKFEITAQERAQIEDIVGTDDPVDLATFIGTAIRYQIWVDYHRDLAALLRDTGINEDVTASNAWATSSGTPAQDIHSALDLILGEADVMIAGTDSFRNLQFSETVREFAGVGVLGNDGAAPRQAVEEWVGSIFGIDTVIRPKLWFNNENYQQLGMTPQRVFDGDVWIGSTSAAANIEQQNDEPTAETNEPAGQGLEEWYGTRTLEPHRVGETALGCYIDGTV